MLRRARFSLVIALWWFACVLLPGTARAAGFLFYETGASEIGLASAGYAARALGPSTLLTNPAGMTGLEGSQVQLGTHLIYGHLQFAHDAQTDPILGTNDGGNSVGAVPSLGAAPAGPRGWRYTCGMRRVLQRCELRPFLPEDASSLAHLANDITVWRNLRDLFPHPYTLEHAVGFIEHTLSQSPPCHCAIVIDAQAVGSIGLKLGTDVERVSAELGYWLGAPYRGRGVMSEAIRAFTDDALETFSLTRIFALPFAHNVASCRALENAGFTLEAVLRRSCIKEGVVTDQRQYARVPEPES